MPLKVYFTSLPAEPYFTYEMHARSAGRSRLFCVGPGEEAFKKQYRTLDASLKTLLGVPSYYRLYLMRPSAWTNFIHTAFSGSTTIRTAGAAYWKTYLNTIPSGFLDIVELSSDMEHNSTGIPGSPILVSGSFMEQHPLALEKYNGGPSILDVSFSFPFGVPEGVDAEVIMFQINGAMGVPLPLMVMFARKDLDRIGRWDSYLQDLSLHDVYLTEKITSDYISKGVEQIRREMLYKRAVLQNALEGAPGLQLVPTGVKDTNTFLFRSEGDGAAFRQKFEEKGLILGDGSLFGYHNANTISNYPTHSKEQAELLADLLCGQ